MYMLLHLNNYHSPYLKEIALEYFMGLRTEIC